ncbi:hypothetical protein [Mycobacterium sp. 3519A]|uniref:hypothetical protein n=1 Tax=Mycobacterium sp. 3519A TaxID=2057184 RepID=UPI000C7D64FB|nr:hypothetical protein [Mycobacterium sp. 3519A]
MANRTKRHITTLAATVTIAVIFAAGCQSSGEQPPTTTPTTPTTTSTTTPPTPPSRPSAPPPPTPTAKDANPTGGNLFTPRIHAPAAPTVRPGQHPGLHGIP